MNLVEYDILNGYVLLFWCLSFMLYLMMSPVSVWSMRKYLFSRRDICNPGTVSILYNKKIIYNFTEGNMTCDRNSLKLRMKKDVINMMYTYSKGISYIWDLCHVCIDKRIIRMYIELSLIIKHWKIL